jgi:hypothetical protein
VTCLTTKLEYLGWTPVREQSDPQPVVDSIKRSKPTTTIPVWRSCAPLSSRSPASEIALLARMDNDAQATMDHGVPSCGRCKRRPCTAGFRTCDFCRAADSCRAWLKRNPPVLTLVWVTYGSFVGFVHVPVQAPWPGLPATQRRAETNVRRRLVWAETNVVRESTSCTQVAACFAETMRLTLWTGLPDTTRRFRGS